MNFFKSNIWEINRSSSLQNMGVILSLLHFINFFYWRSQGHIFSADAAKPLLCWDLFTNCDQSFLITHPSLLSFLFVSYAVLAALSFVFFIWRQFTGVSWFFLATTNLLMMLFFFSDASLNQDIFSLFIALNFVFLLIPGKAILLRSLVIIFYFVSGVRELNPELLSGISLHEWVPYNYKLLEWISSLGVAIKMILPLLLISPIGQRVLLAVLILSGYHLFHLYFIQDFKSVVYLGLLVFFIFDYFSRKKLEFEALYQSYAHPEPSRLWWVAVVSLYVLIQTPLLGRHTLNRFLYVSEPFQTSECNLATFLTTDTATSHVANTHATALQGPLRCHPRIAFNTAKELCTQYSKVSQFRSLNATFVSRRLAQNSADILFSIDNICDPAVTYKAGLVKHEPTK